ncbi:MULTISPECIES: conjugal transfer protein TraF [Cupriavidus]|uniref:conjugal transfer protein TraF n=1 Tax=Cupriavidus TaxID=106589 RepID=UPI0011EFC71A|nr:MULTISPECIES: conjugal transfer protein TraF [Cupriavidus]MWL91857.1 conjugal transfer protein TraF [Cupriavidus sp. SW-Y-13]
MTKTLLVLALLSLTFGAAQAREDDSTPTRFLERKAEGWFWYQDPKDEIPPEPPAQQPPAPPQKQDTAKPKKPEKTQDEPFSVEWLRASMPKLLDAAINDPTKENVEAYLYAQRVAMDKSQRYAEMTQRVVAADPFLDENNRVPIAAYTKAFFLRQLGQGTSEALKHIAKVGGLWVFFDSKCEYCRPQANSVQEISKKYGFITKFISMDGRPLPNVPTFANDNGHAKLLNLRLTPTTVLVVPPNNYFVVSQGMMAQDQLEQRIIIAAESNNLLPPDLAAKIRTYDRGVLSNEDMKKGAGDDPKAWVKYLKDRLDGRY